MRTIATNVRFPKADYDELRALAYQENVSIASIINSAVREYKTKKLSRIRKKRMKLFEEMSKSRIKINTSTVDLVKEGRRFE